MQRNGNGGSQIAYVITLAAGHLPYLCTLHTLHIRTAAAVTSAVILSIGASVASANVLEWRSHGSTKQRRLFFLLVSFPPTTTMAEQRMRSPLSAVEEENAQIRNLQTSVGNRKYDLIQHARHDSVGVSGGDVGEMLGFNARAYTLTLHSRTLH